MIIDKFKLSVAIILFALFQIIINVSTTFYIDCIGIILTILLFIDDVSIFSIVIISLIADLIGQWYIGSHLFAIIFCSFFTKSFINFYKMTNPGNKYFIIILFYSFLSGILTIISYVSHNFGFSIYNYLLDIIAIIPLILFIFHKFIIEYVLDNI